MSSPASTSTFQSPAVSRSYDGWIILGYAAFAVVASAAMYLASGGPGLSDADFAIAMAMP